MAEPKIAFSITVDPQHEGGFQIKENDHGNWTGGKIGEGKLVGTKYGISAAEFPNLDIFNLTPGDAIEIYTERYWKPFYSQIESQDIANKLADLGVLFGVKVAVTILQGVLRLDMDGVFGPDTLYAVNESDSSSLLLAYKTAFVQHALDIGAKNVEERPFVGDWIRRINS